MNVNSSATRQTLSYVFTAAANPATATPSQNTSLPSAAASPVSGSASGRPAVAYPDGTWPAGSISAEEARQNLLDFLENPDTVRLKKMRLSPAAITYGPPSPRVAQTQPFVSPPPDPNIPIHVGVIRGDGRFGIGVGNPVTSYMMLRSYIHSREVAGQTPKVVEGRDNVPVDAHQYLATLRQAAIASVKAQGNIDKAA